MSFGMSKETNLPILYSFRRCPYAIRARLALLQSKISVELREVVLRDRPQHMLDISPKGTVPVLLLPDGVVLEESLDIMLWALDDASVLGDWKRLVDENDGAFKHHLDRYKYNNRYEDALTANEHRNKVLEYLEEYDKRLTHSSYLCGEKPTLADYALAPFVRQFANTDRMWFDQLTLPSLHRWLASILESELFVQSMTKFNQWKIGDKPIVFG